jgi:hypothetical protein
MPAASADGVGEVVSGVAVERGVPRQLLPDVGLTVAVAVLPTLLQGHPRLARSKIRGFAASPSM